MAAATVTKTEWGFEVSGGTDATLISDDKLWVKELAFAGAAATATAVLTTKMSDGLNTPISCAKFKAASGSELDVSKERIFFGDRGVPMTGLTVTLGATGDILYVYLKF